jgi:arylamine N-acetyltransferase
MTAISTKLRTKVLNRLGLNEPQITDLNTLQRIYTSWCLQVPFDNLRKMIALKSPEKQQLPGLDASDFFESWLENGCGATCWPMANAFYELLISIGFDATRITGYMRDLGILNHGSVKVSINGNDYIAEASLLLQKVFPLSGNTIIGNDVVFPAEIEKDGESYLLWIQTPPGKDYFYCRINSNPVDFLVFDKGYESSRERGIFNQRLYARKNYPGKLIILWGNAFFSKTINGIDLRELSGDELCEALKSDIGITDSLINEWINAGCLEASFEKPSGTPPPPVTIKPPSQRNN